MLARRPHQHARPSRRRTSAARSWSCSRWASAHYTEADVYAAARVFTGWNLARPGAAGDGSQHYEFVYNAGQHDTGEKTFSFPIYADGSKTIPARAGRRRHAGRPRFHQRAGRQSRTPAATWRRKLYRFFVVGVRRRRRQRSWSAIAVGLSAEPLRHEGRSMREVLLSPQFWDRRRLLRALLVAGGVRRPRDEGHRLDAASRSNDALTPLSNMGQNLYDPPDVAGWDVGPVVVLDRLDAGAHELRLDARRQSAVQSGRGGRRRMRSRPRRCCPTCSTR